MVRRRHLGRAEPPPPRTCRRVLVGILGVVILLGEFARELLRLASLLRAATLLIVAALVHPRGEVVVALVGFAELLGGAVARLHQSAFLGGCDPRRDLGRLLRLRLVRARGVRRLLRLALRLGAVALAGAQRLQTELLAHAIGLLEGHRNLAARLVGADVEALGERLVILTHDGALHDVGKAVEMDRARTTVRSDRRRRDERACRALECSSPSSPLASPFPFRRELAGEAGQILDFQNAESEVARHLTVVVAGQRPVMGEGEGSRARGGVASTSCDAFIAEHLLVYATARWHYVVAGSGDKSRWRILKISHEESPAGRGLVVAEDRTEYDEGQCARIIAAIADGNAATGGARQVARGVALLGSIRLVTGHHLILAKERVPLGTVCGHAVYGVGATELVRVASASPRRNARDAHRPPRRAAADANAEERRLKRLLSRVDLTGGFFFSHTYRLTATLQANAFDPNAALRRDFDSMFAWNAHLSHPLRAALGEDAASRWLVPLVHGFFSQRVVDLVGRRVRIALVARRSRHFAGTRYRRRGVNEEGHVANEVETEQIVDDPGGRGFGSRRVPAVSSVVQTRGSIPLFWTQELSARVARPEITLQRFDPTHAATARHFQRLDDRFGPPTLVLSLVRSQERRAREGALRGELAAALHRVNSRLPEARERVACVHWDFAKHMTRGGGGGGGGRGVKRGDGVSGEARNPSNPPLEPPPPPPPPFPSPAPATTPGLLELTRVAAGALELTGVFVVAPVAGLRSAEKRRATDGRGGPVSRATTAWREARCELFTGMDVVGDDARAAPLGGGDPDAPAPGAGRSANPWKHAVGVITPNDSSAPNVPRASSVGVARQRGVLRSH